MDFYFESHISRIFLPGSGRADGAVCEFSNDQGMEYYNKLKNNGIVNVEMESLAFAALTCRAGIKSAVMAVILSDRLETDQVHQNFPRFWGFTLYKHDFYDNLGIGRPMGINRISYLNNR